VLFGLFPRMADIRSIDRSGDPIEHCVLIFQRV